MLHYAAALWTDESGGTLAEYALVALLLAVPCIAALLAIANNCGVTLTTTGNGLTSIAVTNP